ncbi:MAG TPA: hypothetical protein VIH57_23800 [Bacteroidales bacterium]
MAKKNSSTSKVKIDAKTILEELKTPGLIILGMVGGNLAGKLVDKVVKVDATATNFQAKALLKPIIQISAGVGGALFLKDKNLKLIASGVAASGIASTIKVFLKKDILQGLTEFTGLGASDPVKQVFREPFNLAIEPYNPDLPKLPPAQVEAIPVESEGEDMGEYEEIKEISIL